MFGRRVWTWIESELDFGGLALSVRFELVLCGLMFVFEVEVVTLLVTMRMEKAARTEE